MKKYIFLLTLFLFACSDGDEYIEPMPGSAFCVASELEVISDGKSCDESDHPFVCEVIEIEEPQYIDDESYEWSPGICDLQISDQIAFKNQSNTSFFTVVDRGHYIADERINVGCNENYEHATYICQKNEVVYVCFLNDLLGRDTMTIELRTMTLSYEDQTPGMKRNIINFFQDRSFSNVRNFWIRHFIGDDYYEHLWQSYHEEITLNGNVYRDVVKYEYGVNIHADPDYRYYLQKGRGIIGFEVNDELWLRE